MIVLYVMTGMLDVIQNEETRSVEDDANGRKVNERDLDNEVVDESVLFYVTNTTQETSREGVEGNQIVGVRPKSVTSATNAHQGYEEQTCSSLNSAVASESGSLCSTPVAVERGRKRQRLPENWERNKKKRALNAGEEYTGKDGKTTKGRSNKPGCGLKMCQKML